MGLYSIYLRAVKLNLTALFIITLEYIRLYFLRIFLYGSKNFKEFRNEFCEYNNKDN